MKCCFCDADLLEYEKSPGYRVFSITAPTEHEREALGLTLRDAIIEDTYACGKCLDAIAEGYNGKSDFEVRID